ncbi:MAG: hypothetical protein R3B83_10770 [Nitrospirales bacterium]|nr:hypothetical protein [Nitrospirales bacterium]
MNNNAAPTQSEKKASPKTHLAGSKDSINVIVVADTDILQGSFLGQVQDFFRPTDWHSQRGGTEHS